MTVPDAWPELLGTQRTGPTSPAGRPCGAGGLSEGAGPGRVRGYQRHGARPRPPRGLRRLGRGRGGRVGIYGPAAVLPAQRAGRRPGPGLRGTAGPVRVAPVPEGDRHPVAVAFAAALAQIGCPATDDLSGPPQEGVAWADLAIAGGQRVSPADAYLAAGHRPNLTVQTGCLVTRLHVRHGRCTGVSYVRDGAPAEAHACGEVIVCAGAIGSPQLLMLSGIGPAAQLRALGIDVVADLPGVGENLQDHPTVLASYAPGSPLPPAGTTTGRCTRRCAARWPVPALTCTCSRSCCRWPRPGASRRPAGFALVAAVVAPDSRGWVRLASPDPDAAPVINPAFLRDPRDLDRLEAGLTLVREAAASAAFARVGRPRPGPACRPGPAPDCGTTSAARSAATTTRPAPAGSGTGRRRGGGHRAARPRDHRAAGGRRIGDAGPPQRPPERHRAGHRRESRRPDQRPAAPSACQYHQHSVTTTPAGFFQEG